MSVYQNAEDAWGSQTKLDRIRLSTQLQGHILDADVHNPANKLGFPVVDIRWNLLRLRSGDQCYTLVA